MASSRGKRLQQILVGSSLVLAGGYAGYQVYNSILWSRAKQQLLLLEEACTALNRAAKGGGDVVHLVTSELEAFLQSDSDEVPRSVRQLLKIAASPEFQRSAAAISGSLAKGVMGAAQISIPRKFSQRSCVHCVEPDWDGMDYDSILKAGAYGNEGYACNGAEEPGFVDKVMDRMFTKAGRGFASVVVGSVVRDLFTAYLESAKAGEQGEGKSAAGERGLTETVFDLACTDKGRTLVTECVTTLVVNAVTVFLDKTADVNVYDEMWASMSKPGHRDQVRDIIGTVANSAVESLVRTSHEVFTGEKPSRPPASAAKEHAVFSLGPSLEPRVLWPEEESQGEANAEGLHCSAGMNEKDERAAESGRAGDDGKGKQIVERQTARSSMLIGAGTSVGSEGYSWLHQLFQTLIDPRNRRLLMDVTGVAAYEAIRALIAGLHDVLRKSQEGRRRPGDRSSGMTTAVVGVTRAVDDYFRAIAAKALVCVTVCLALCLNMVSGIAYTA